MVTQQEISALAGRFRACQRTMTAMGDPVRQHLILVMMQSGSCSGLRVGEIARGTNLSRPAVSHHLKILREAGIVKMRREGTRNYYYFDADPEAVRDMIDLFTQVQNIMAALPDRSEME